MNKHFHVDALRLQETDAMEEQNAAMCILMALKRHVAAKRQQQKRMERARRQERLEERDRLLEAGAELSEAYFLSDGTCRVHLNKKGMCMTCNGEIEEEGQMRRLAYLRDNPFTMYPW